MHREQIKDGAEHANGSYMTGNALQRGGAKKTCDHQQVINAPLCLCGQFASQRGLCCRCCCHCRHLLLLPDRPACLVHQRAVIQHPLNLLHGDVLACEKVQGVWLGEDAA